MNLTTMKTNGKTYSEMVCLATFEERFDYLKLDGVVADDTFGWDRYMNQALYKSYEWKNIRRKVIIRDNGCDLGCAGYEIDRGILIHHINPITADDIYNRNPVIFDMDNLISTSRRTHNAIHYGDRNLLYEIPNNRNKYDTCPWKH